MRIVQYFLFALICGSVLPASADYYDLARQESARAAAQAKARQEAEVQQSITDFNSRLTRLVFDFGRTHGGFVNGNPAPEMNNLIPGRIAQYLFATNDGYECAAKYGFMESLGTNEDYAALYCINARTGKHYSRKL